MTSRDPKAEATGLAPGDDSNAEACGLPARGEDYDNDPQLSSLRAVWLPPIALLSFTRP